MLRNSSFEEPADRDGLLELVRSRFEVTRQSLAFGKFRISCYKPADPESVLDEETLMRSHEELEWQPYWAQAWDAGMGMCAHVAGMDIRDKQVLDLGCGIGLTSALLLAAGAHVTCGDNAPPSLAFARINTWPWRQRANVRWIDWHTTRLTNRFDWIFGSDIVYEHREVEPLDRFFRQHLAAGGRVVLSDPSRPMTRDFLAAFANLGWFQMEESLRVIDIKQPIRLVTMHLDETS